MKITMKLLTKPSTILVALFTITTVLSSCSKDNNEPNINSELVGVWQREGKKEDKQQPENLKTLYTETFNFSANGEGLWTYAETTIDTEITTAPEVTTSTDGNADKSIVDETILTKELTWSASDTTISIAYGLTAPQTYEYEITEDKEGIWLTVGWVNKKYHKVL